MTDWFNFHITRNTSRWLYASSFIKINYFEFRLESRRKTSYFIWNFTNRNSLFGVFLEKCFLIPSVWYEKLVWMCHQWSTDGSFPASNNSFSFLSQNFLFHGNSGEFPVVSLSSVRSNGPITACLKTTPLFERSSVPATGINSLNSEKPLKSVWTPPSSSLTPYSASSSSLSFSWHRRHQQPHLHHLHHESRSPEPPLLPPAGVSL